MKLELALASAALIALLQPALAQHTTSTSTSASQSGAVAIVNNRTGGGSGTRNNTTVPSSSSSQTIRNVPDIAVGFAGGNPCSVGGGLGVSVAGAGVSGVFSSEAPDCTRRNWSIFLAEVGIKYNDPEARAWSLRIACLNEDVKNTAPSGICETPNQQASDSSLRASRCAAWEPTFRDHTRRNIPPDSNEVAARYSCGF